jgi:hypothetical protein
MEKTGKNVSRSLGAITIASLLFLLNCQKRDSTAGQVDLPQIEIDRAAVTRILINKPDASTELVKADSGWLVNNGSKTFKADEVTVMKMLSYMGQIEGSRLVSDSKDDWEKYGVNTTGSRIQVYEGDQQKADFFLGRMGMLQGGTHTTYFRLASETNVLAADNFRKFNVPDEPNQYRNNVLMRFDPESISKITFDYPDSGSVFVRKERAWFSNGVEADSSLIRGYLNNISYETSSDFVDAPASSSQLKIECENYEGQKIVILAYRDEDGWIVSTSENPSENFRNNKLFDKIFKPVSSFFKS